ncbi:MAG: hypothetical protein N3D79_06545, partial [Acidilobaceae archaeon]|nr:hypothetical protein [Acidilobaceae archaeon]
WKKLLKKVWSIEERASMLDYEERRQLFSAVIQRAEAVKKMIARKIERKIEEELNMLREEVAGHEEEVLRREGVKG